MKQAKEFICLGYRKENIYKYLYFSNAEGKRRNYILFENKTNRAKRAKAGGYKIFVLCLLNVLWKCIGEIFLV